MATEPIPVSPVLRRLADDLDAVCVESRFARGGDLIAEMHAMGHRFRFRITPRGTITGRFCQADPAGILARPEMQILHALAGEEMARMGHGHLNPTRHGQDAFAVLGRAEIKLSLALSSDGHLTRVERDILSTALKKMTSDLTSDGLEPRLQTDAENAVELIRQKLGL